LKPKLKLIVLDCDGVISNGEAQPFDMPLFTRLANLNRQARNGDAVPAVTLNTGRPSPYVEAVMQAIDSRQPALYETGAGMYFPETYQFKITPLLTTHDKITLDKILKQIDDEIVQSEKAYWQPGKSVCHTLFAEPSFTQADFAPQVAAIAKSISNKIAVIPAGLALNIYPAGITKGTGLQWLSQITGISLLEMGGVGDSSSDVDFLRLVGYPAAPKNATDDVKAVAGYVSPKTDIAGLMDILDYWRV